MKEIQNHTETTTKCIDQVQNLQNIVDGVWNLRDQITIINYELAKLNRDVDLLDRIIDPSQNSG